MSQTVIEDLKRIIRRTIDTMKMPNLVLGTVASVSPLSIETSVNQKPYPESVLIVPDHVNLPEELKVGDKVLLMNATGGQKFAIIGKIAGDTGGQE